MARYHSVTSVGSFPERSGEGEGGVSYPVYSNTINDAPYQQTPNMCAQTGDVLVDKYGFQYVYVRATAALAQGQVCRMALNLTGTISAATTAAVINTNITTTFKEADFGSFITGDGAGAPNIRFLKVIKAQTAIGTNTQFTISKRQVFIGLGSFDGDLLAGIPATGDIVHVIRPYGVDVAGIGDQPVGVAMHVVTLGNFGLIQVSGLAQVLAVGSTDAIADNGVAVTAAAGVVKGTLGTATAASAAAEMKSIVGIPKMAYAGASKLMPVWLTLNNRF